MSEPNNQQWLDDAAQQAREHIASLHREGLELLLETQRQDPGSPSRTTSPLPAAAVDSQDAQDMARFGGFL